MRLLTVGHGTLPADEFVLLLQNAQVQRLVDVRTVPHSRHNPQFERGALDVALSRAELTYVWAPDLGGFRRPIAGSPNTALRNAAFRGYADYMQTPPFWKALGELLTDASSVQVAIMCAESVWWRCHRRLIADAVVLKYGVEVQHLLHDAKLVPHRVTEGARVKGGLIIYDVATPPASDVRLPLF